ncbi:MOSC domain-containing protein [uncultured Jatrophihabitans sp.]|uniref:MOSC domain-containing protein n=1 Tax=uncultured Jatrophihabitans sp. TaxID=1610747 RepID=UPI0035CA3BDC
MTGDAAHVHAVHRDAGHRFSKRPVQAITLLAGLGVDGDAHCGVTVQHRSRVRRDPTAPNLRQVHLVQFELLEELNAQGFDVAPGAIGENVTTVGVDLLALPTGTVLQLGPRAVLEVTGLRNPCLQLDRYRRGLQKAVLDRAADGTLLRRAGAMAVVRSGGEVRTGDGIVVEFPPQPHRPLEPV